MGRRLGPCHDGQREERAQQAREDGSGNGGRAERSRVFDPDNPVTWRVSVGIIIALTIYVLTNTIEAFLGIKVFGTTLYWSFVAAIAIILLVAMMTKETNLASFAKVAKVCIAIIILSWFLKAVYGDQTNIRCLSARLHGVPPVSKKVVFDHTYTYADAYDKEHGQIHAYQSGKDDVKVGDEVTVIAKTKDGNFSGNEIAVWEDEAYKKTTNGVFITSVQALHSGKFFCISLGGRRDVEVEVKVERG